MGTKPLTLVSRISEERLTFSCEVIDIRDVDAESLLESVSLEDNLLAILSRHDDPRAVVRRILKRLVPLPEKARADMWSPRRSNTYPSP